MTYKEFKKRDKHYRIAEDVEVSINGDEPLDEMYYPFEWDELQVVGIGISDFGKKLHVDLVR